MDSDSSLALSFKAYFLTKRLSVFFASVLCSALIIMLLMPHTPYARDCLHWRTSYNTEFEDTYITPDYVVIELKKGKKAGLNEEDVADYIIEHFDNLKEKGEVDPNSEIRPPFRFLSCKPMQIIERDFIEGLLGGGKNNFRRVLEKMIETPSLLVSGVSKSFFIGVLFLATLLTVIACLPLFMYRTLINETNIKLRPTKKYIGTVGIISILLLVAISTEGIWTVERIYFHDNQYDLPRMSWFESIGFGSIFFLILFAVFSFIVVNNIALAFVNFKFKQVAQQDAQIPNTDISVLYLIIFSSLTFCATLLVAPLSAIIILCIWIFSGCVLFAVFSIKKLLSQK